MTQKELYNLAGKLSSNDVAYLVCSHMEHIGKAEFGFKIDLEDKIFRGNVVCKSTKFRYLFNDENVNWCRDSYINEMFLRQQEHYWQETLNHAMYVIPLIVVLEQLGFDVSDKDTKICLNGWRIGDHIDFGIEVEDDHVWLLFNCRPL